VALTKDEFSPNSIISFLKRFSLRKDLTIVPKIQDKVSSLELGIENKEKWRVKRKVKADLPPPGGPQAQTRIVLSISFHWKVFLS
jgi:hypothetical protein